jgi:hypothetical protein
MVACAAASDAVQRTISNTATTIVRLISFSSCTRDSLRGFCLQAEEQSGAAEHFRLKAEATRATHTLARP